MSLPCYSVKFESQNCTNTSVGWKGLLGLILPKTLLKAGLSLEADQLCPVMSFKHPVLEVTK